jgi:hypothetical protein
MRSVMMYLIRISLGRAKYDPNIWSGDAVADAIGDMGFDAKVKRVEGNTDLQFDCFSEAAYFGVVHICTLA